MNGLLEIDACSKIGGVGVVPIVHGNARLLTWELGCSAMTSAAPSHNSVLPQFCRLREARRAKPAAVMQQGPPQNEGNHAGALPHRTEHWLGLVGL